MSSPHPKQNYNWSLWATPDRVYHNHCYEKECVCAMYICIVYFRNTPFKELRTSRVQVPDYRFRVFIQLTISRHIKSTIFWMVSKSTVFLDNMLYFVVTWKLYSNFNCLTLQVVHKIAIISKLDKLWWTCCDMWLIIKLHILRIISPYSYLMN